MANRSGIILASQARPWDFSSHKFLEVSLHGKTFGEWFRKLAVWFGSVVWAKRLHQIAQAIHDSPQHSLAEASSLSINLLASSLFKEKKPVSISTG